MTHMRHLAAAAALAALSFTAQAQGTAGGYVSLGGGLSSWDVDCEGTIRCDKSGSALRLAGGYRFGNGLAVEALYLNLGKTSADVNSFIGVVKSEIKGSAAGAGLAVFLPLGPNAELAARLGVASVSGKATGSATGFATTTVADERKAKLYAGLGLAWRFTPTVQMELNWDTTKVELFDEDAQVNTVTVGIGFRF
jgi:OmpA-OmpF porin, OOP family